MERHKRNSHLKRHFGISVDQFDAILADQGGVCAICGEVPNDRRGYYPHVDHCHASGRVRGILCTVCNNALGKFRDNPDLLDRAAQYLRRNAIPSVAAVGDVD